eukprot:5222211-Pleurochrysis_carterae.AAC.1
MVGFSAREGEDGVRPRAAAQLLAAAAGDMAAVDGVEAGLLAAATAQTEGVEEAAATTRLRRAGVACAAALRTALDAMGAEGALDAAEEAAR